MKQQALMLGAGHKAPKRMLETKWSAKEEDTEWTTLDFYVPADIKMNLWDTANNSPEEVKAFNGIDVPAELYHEVHAYEVLEHYGHRGIPEHFFNSFGWLWERLRPNGCLIGTAPLSTGPWVEGDPGHSRVINRETMSFLEESFYEQCGKTSASDYRPLMNNRYWRILQANDDVNLGSFCFALQKVVK